MVILKKRVPGLDEASLDRFLGRARRAVGLRGKVTVLVTTNRALRVLNQRFRGKDHPTDVLSFPADRLESSEFAGDVAISAEIAAQNARRLGHAPKEEIKVLALHGVLHLAGYDHERDHGEMARKEERLRKQLGLPAALIERTLGAPRRQTTAKRIPNTPAPPAKRSSHAGPSRVLAKRRPAR
jgi:probable rRNA maturation factor